MFDRMDAATTAWSDSWIAVFTGMSKPVIVIRQNRSKCRVDSQESVLQKDDAAFACQAGGR
jgi:hypothetical protein